MKKYFSSPWSIKDLITVTLISATLLALTLLVFEQFSIKQTLEKSTYSSLYLLGLFLLQWVIAIVPFLVLTIIKHKFSWKDLGFIPIKISEIIKYILGGYLIWIVITFIMTMIILYTGLKIPGYQVQQDILPFFGDGIVNLVVAGLVIVIIAPLLEEVFFRGFILRTLSNNLGIFTGSILSAAIFAIFHFQLETILPIFILGLIINRMVIKSKSILPAIGFHVFNNALAFTIELLILKEVIKIEEIIT